MAGVESPKKWGVGGAKGNSQSMTILRIKGGTERAGAEGLESQML